MSYGIMTSYRRDDTLELEFGREVLQIWSGPFFSVWEARAVALPKGDGYMITTYNGDKIRCTCPTPRTDDNYREIDAALSAALKAFHKED